MIRLVRFVFLLFVALTQASIIHTEVPDPIHTVVHPNEIVQAIPYHHAIQQQPSLPGITLFTGTQSFLGPDPKLHGIVHEVVTKSLLAKLKALAPKVLKEVLKVAVKLGLVVVTALTLAIVGVGFTAAVCTYTNLCSFKLAHLAWDKLDSERMEETMRAYMPRDKLASLAKFVVDSIQEYAAKNSEQSAD